MRKFRPLLAKALLVTMFMATMLIQVNTASAASVTSLSDVMSREKASTASNHEIKFVSPTGIAAGNTVTLTFSAGFTGVAGILFSDVDFATGNSSSCSGATFTEQTLAASPATTTWGVASAGQVITLTSGTGTATAGNCVRFRIGTNAVNQTTGVNQISNGATGANDTVAVAGTFGDTGTLSVDVITNDQVVVSATVDPSITFTISTNTVGFGSLTSGAARYANSAGTGSASDVAAVNLTVATNASSGYVLSYNGPTLTSAALDTIAVATITASATGTPGTAQFASGYTASGGSTVVTAYANASNNWTYVASTTTTVVSRTTPVNTETIGAHFLSNIAGNTPAGSYTATLTYIATGTY